MVNWKAQVEFQRGAMGLDRASDAALFRLASAYPESLPMQDGGARLPQLAGLGRPRNGRALGARQPRPE